MLPSQLPKPPALKPQPTIRADPLSRVNALVDQVLPAQKPEQTLISGDAHPPLSVIGAHWHRDREHAGQGNPVAETSATAMWREKRQEAPRKGLTRAGNARVRRGMIQLAWRFLEFQKESAANWFEARTETMGLSPLEPIPLAEARERARAARGRLLDGKDPIEVRNAEQLAEC